MSKVLTSDYGGYSSLAVLPDMTIACLYETAGTSTITLARFDLAWLTDGKDMLQPPSREPSCWPRLRSDCWDWPRLCAAADELQ